MREKVIPLGLIILLFIFTISCKQNNVNDKSSGNTLVNFDGGKITTGDVDDFKKYRHDNLSIDQALEMMIERELLYKEAEKQGKVVSFKEAQTESNKARSAFEQYGTEQDKKLVQDEIEKLKISSDEYWNNYHPKQLIKPLTIGIMTKTIKDTIYADIVKNHSDWGQAEIEKGLKEAYHKVINDLKSKYSVRYFD